MRREAVCGLAGLLGVLSIACGIAVSMRFYNVQNDGAYSALNHFISELGWMKKSPLFWAFSAGIIGGGLLCALPAWSAGLSLGGRYGRFAALFGASASLSAVGVGLLPMDWIYPHSLFAFLYFSSWILASAFFAKAFLAREGCGVSRALGVYCLCSALASATFLVIPFFLIGTLTVDGDLNQLLKVLETFQRPRLWPVAIMEWLVLLSSCVWSVAISLCLLKGLFSPRSPS